MQSDEIGAVPVPGTFPHKVKLFTMAWRSATRDQQVEATDDEYMSEFISRHGLVAINTDMANALADEIDRRPDDSVVSLESMARLRNWLRRVVASPDAVPHFDRDAVVDLADRCLAEHWLLPRVPSIEGIDPDTDIVCQEIMAQIDDGETHRTDDYDGTGTGLVARVMAKAMVGRTTVYSRLQMLEQAGRIHVPGTRMRRKGPKRLHE